MLTAYSDDHRLQNARFELVDGKLLPPFENPLRADRVLAQVQKVGLGQVLPIQEFGLAPILQIHDPKYVAFLQIAWQDWVAAHGDRKSTRLNSSHSTLSRMPSSA